MSRAPFHARVLHYAVLSLTVCSLLLNQPYAPAQQSQPPQTVQSTSDTTPLEQGRPVEKELAGGQKHLYQLSLSQGQYVQVEVKQNGIDVGIALYSPAGKVASMIEPFRMVNERKFDFVAEATGVYGLEVYTGAKVPKGRYEICVTELRAANANDVALDEARRLFNQYFQLHRQGRFVEARPSLIRVLEIRERVLGPDHLLVAATIDNLATNLSITGDYASAVALRERGIKIREKIRGAVHPEVAFSLTGLGIVYQEKGDSAKAKETFEKALNMYEQLNLTEHLNFAALLGYLGDISYDAEDYSTAEKYFDQARTIYEKLLGPNHYHLADSFSSLGLVAYARADYAKAEEMFQRAVTLAEKSNHDSTGLAGRLNNLAMLYGTTRQYEKAESIYLRALSMLERLAALNGPHAQTTLFGLARIYAAQGRLADAIKYQTWGSESEERYIQLNLSSGSEREKLSLVAPLAARMSRTISLHSYLAPNDPKALELALTTVLRRKGRVQDMMSESLAALRRRFRSEDQKLLDQLNEVTSNLANLSLNGPQRETPAEYQDKIKKLEERLENLEDEVGRRSAGFYDRTRPIRVSSLQSAIPADAALLEFAVCQPFDAKAPDNQSAYGEPHYIVYVVRSQGEVHWKDLGTVKVIDERLQALRKALADPKSDIKQLAREVDERVTRPLRPWLSDITQLLVSPDGALNLLPFEALIDERGQFLVERYSVSYLTSGRDLLRLQVPRHSRSNPIVVADPLFGSSDPQNKPASHETRENGSLVRQSPLTATELSNASFAPLRGTHSEALAIKSVYSDATVLTGRQASELSLKNVAAPTILHIATHGFFLTDHSVAGSKSEPSGGVGIHNPLLRSGLALAGANLRRAGGTDDGILTALEASGLDLWGTQLVVLFACDTGLGQVENGEGVYGLRRAFVLAAAESLVMSLWSVNDYSTRRLMVDYYKNLKRGLGRGAALREVKLEMLKRNPNLHPFYWANFIQSGDWRTLTGPK